MIHLTLLHPVKNTPVQSWTFANEAVIRIGRGTDNNVILYSAVVSRHHAELRCNGSEWEVINLGTNGTYLDGKRITQVPVVDGTILRLARSGPKIQIHLGDKSIESLPKSSAVPVSGSLLGLTPDTAEAGDTEKTIPGPHALLNQPLAPPPSPQQAVGNDQLPDHFFPITDPDLAAMPLLAVEPPNIEMQLGHPHSSHEMESVDLRFDLSTGKPLRVLKQVADYQVVDVVGQGRVAITYLAWRNGQTVALKTVNADWLGDPEAIGMFEHEATVLSRLHHPSIPQFIDFFSIASQPYLAMEMIYGQTLANYVAANGKVPQRQAIQWMIEVCNTLDYLHSLDPPILHCNLRPNNLIRRNNRHGSYEIAVLDVGAVRVVGLEADTHIEMESYAAPEQQEGHAVPASDLYAIGTVLIYLLTGQPPSKFYKPVDNEFQLSIQLIPNLHPAIKDFLIKLVNPRVECRHATAKEVANCLAEILSNC
ncbi:MAG: FHA domain-containing protein [Cyanobacteria bacterium]|nr:FHA domain-containing protein [Cyanobacteriota bacterium]MDW8201167.1 FHA domain-containing protein [Cyanobacteriota bacterium SKYGB_h_bin112]